MAAVSVGSPAHADTQAGEDAITVVIVGDVGLNHHKQRVHPDGYKRYGKFYKWPELTKDIKALINGHINFMNVETVVTNSNRLSPVKKAVNFRTHPNGFKHLVDVGFNLLSLANNHSSDYGPKGVLHTLSHVKAVKAKLLGWAGLGANRDEATAPASFVVNKRTFALGALGITGQPVRKHVAGCPGPWGGYWKQVTKRLRETNASFRMLSIHEGPERRVRPTRHLRRKWRSSMADGSADLIIGHHSHVARGIERNKHGFIFYGLGNFLLRGDRNLRKVWSYRLCRDFGLLARVHVRPDGKGRMRTRAIEIVPVRGVSRIPRAMAPAESRKRVEAINYLASKLDSKKRGAVGVRFAPQADGSGLYCEPGADKDPGKVGRLCRNYQPPAAATGKWLRKLRYACRKLSASERNPKPLYRSPPKKHRKRSRR